LPLNRNSRQPKVKVFLQSSDPAKRQTLPEATVDPRVFSEKPGSLTDFSSGDDSVNYLRRLKEDKTSGLPANGNAKGYNRSAVTTPTAGMVERRKTPRHRCSGTVEFRAEGSDVRLWGTLTDISLHGCYLEMNTTFPVNTKVLLVLKSCGIQVQAPGTVRATYPFLGMGIRFAEIEPGQQLQLQQLLDSLTGRNAVHATGPASDSAMHDTLASADPRALVDVITEFFRKDQLLSRDEFHKMAKRVRRS
jgi:hypothetical protein